MFKRFFFLTFSLWATLFAQAGLFSKPAFLSAAEAFAFSSVPKPREVELHWQIADGYYLYKKEIKVSAPNAPSAEIGEPQFPAAERYHDEFFGEVEIFRHALKVTVPVKPTGPSDRLEVRYQGCTKGFCYPPETIEITLDEQAVEKNENFAKNRQNPAVSASISEDLKTERPQTRHDQLAAQLSDSRFSVFWFFVFGIGLAFTPCVLPMLPLLSSIVIGNKKRPGNGKALLLSFTYVQGMALTYTLLGLIVAAIGLPFQIALQSPPVLVTLAVLFTILSLSMFGLFEIRLPNAWQQKLNAMSQKQKGGALGSVFVMGIIAGLVASPCTSAPLSGALLYVAQSGDLLTGGSALYLLALGMGTPLILITLFGNKILPKSGEWLLRVKTAFGFVMLALPVFLLARVLPVEYEPFMWSALAVVFLGWLISIVPVKGFVKQTIRIALFFAFALAAYPWANLVWNPGSNASIETTAHFRPERIVSLTDLEEKLAAAGGKKVMLDLYADWCVACKEFEKYTFNDAGVRQQFEQMLVLQVDMTKNSVQNEELMKRFQVLGLPTILFFDENGAEISDARVTGFLNANQFLERLNKL